MKSRGQFMIISAVIAGLITIALSSSITDIQSQSYEPQQLPEHINQLRDEAERITADGVITQEEMRNFRKMTSYVESYRITTEFNVTGNCVNIRIKDPERTAELPCIN
jgi:hypothetical protein